MAVKTFARKIFWVELVTIAYVCLVGAFYHSSSKPLRITFLATSNLFAIPPIIQCIKGHLWFESGFLTVMFIVSLTYHITYGIGMGIGLWFRHLDWILAYTTGLVFLNCFFFSRHSYNKMISNFCIFAVTSLFVENMGKNVLIFIIPSSIYAIIILSLGTRHLKDISKIRLLFVIIWISFGVILFFLADIYICKGNNGFGYYPPLHSCWHALVFLGIYELLKMGCIEDDGTFLSITDYQNEKHEI